MLPLSRFHFVLAFVALMMLRVVVGFHFFKEGTDKLKSGDFTAEYFLDAAKGPLAPYFHELIDGRDGRYRFCLSDDGHSLDPELTFAIWEDFLDRAYGHFKFGDAKIEADLIERRAVLAERIVQARIDNDTSVDVDQLETLRADDEQNIKKLRRQADAGEKILAAHQQELQDWIDVNEAEVLAYFKSADRIDGFDRDGTAAVLVATQVDSLREQVASIKADRKKQQLAWAAQIDAMWDSYEQQILQLPIDRQRSEKALSLHRPFAQPNSRLQWINRLIPWFDTIVGGLLIIGLFTRLASLAAALFLVSVIAAQPPWIPGTEPTYLYAVELFALLVIFATCAGRFGGLDFFFARRCNNRVTAVGTPPTNN